MIARLKANKGSSSFNRWRGMRSRSVSRPTQRKDFFLWIWAIRFSIFIVVGWIGRALSKYFGGLLEAFGIVHQHQFIDDPLYVPVDDVLQVVKGKPDPVVGAPALRIVVGPDLGRAVPTAHLGVPFGGILRLFFGQFHIIEP